MVVEQREREREDHQRREEKEEKRGKEINGAAMREREGRKAVRRRMQGQK